MTDETEDLTTRDARTLEEIEAHLVRHEEHCRLQITSSIGKSSTAERKRRYADARRWRRLIASLVPEDVE